MPRIEELIRSPSPGYPSSLEAMNILFDCRPYKESSIFGWFARPNTGKTLLALQEAIFHAGQGRGSIIIDTEDSIDHHINTWGSRLIDRFGVPQAPIDIEVARTLEELLGLFGYKAVVEIGERKSRIRIQEVSTTSPIEALIRRASKDGRPQHRILILDSLTYPLKEIPPDTQNFPVRSQAISYIFRALGQLRSRYGLSIVLTNHASKNPQEQAYTGVQAYGGDSLIYNMKQILYIDMRNGADYRMYRRLWVYRKPDTPPMSRASVAMVTDKGFVDIDKKYWRVQFTQKELKDVLREKPWEAGESCTS